MMKMYKIFTLFLVMFSLTTLAQTTKEYKTEKGESLRDVAKKFDLGYRDLIKANPDVSRWPKKNTIVKIPNNLPKLKGNVKVPKDFRPEDKSDLVKVKSEALDSIIKHVIKPKETLYSLSKLYSVSMTTILKENPVLSIDGLKIGQELNIPYQNKEVLKFSKKHVVKEKETLYAISKSYGISVDELLKVNDSIVVDSLSIGTRLVLPKKVVASVEVSTATPFYKQSPVFYHYHNDVDSLEVVLKEYSISKDSLQSLNPALDSVINYGGKLLMGFEKTHQLFGNQKTFKDSIVVDKVIKAMIMLPFDFKKNDTLSKEILFANKKGVPTIVSEFYMGVEIAIDSLRKQGVQVSLDVVDTEKSIDSIYKNISTFKALKPDLIIGPLYSSNAIYVATQFTGVPMYYPIFSKKQSTFSNSNIVKTSSDKTILKKEVLEYIKENRKGEHLLIVGLEKDGKNLKQLKNTLSKKDSLGHNIVDDVSVITLSNGYISKEDFLEKIKLDKPNWILIADKNNVITADVFNNVISLPKENKDMTPIRIISFEKSTHIEKLSYQTLYDYKYTYATDNVEYSALENKSFEQAFFSKNHQYPSNYAIRGFDVTYDAILRMLKVKTKDNDVIAPSYRYKTAFVYKKGDFPTKTNQAVFVNSIGKTEKEGLKIIRLR